MSAAAEPCVALDAWIQVPASWGTYLRLLRDRGERRWPRYVHNDGRLTIASPGHAHEFMSTRLGFIVGEVLCALGVRFRPTGSITLRAGRGTRKGAEADASYYLTDPERLRGKARIDLDVDPAPDLVIEVVVTNPPDDALEVYAAFGVKEVWVCRVDGITFLSLQPTGLYEPTPVSHWIPTLGPEDLEPWVLRDEFPEELAFRDALRRWIAETLLPRRPRGPETP